MNKPVLRSYRLGRDIELQEGTTRVGRNQDCEVRIDGHHYNQVSRHHLNIRVTGDTVETCDVSTHGTLINGQEIKGQGWVRLAHNDVLELCGVGGVDLRLVDPTSPDRVSGSCVVPNSQDDSRLGGPQSKSLLISKAAHQPDRQLTALLEMTSTLRDVIKTDDVLERAVRTIFQIFPAADRAAICFVNDDGAIEPRWWHVREADPDHIIQLSQNIGRHVIEESNAVILGDAKQDFQYAQSVKATLMRSVMCCPLIDPNDQVFGLIHVDSFLPDRFSETHLEILAAVAMQISLAINCARLHSVAVDDALLRRDIEQAKAVQQRYLPTSAPNIDGFELAGFYRPARLVGGDYFDYIPLPDQRLAIVLADVVGKGVPAAMTMVRLATETRAGLELCSTPAQLLARLNQRLADDFITMVVMILDQTTGNITISNAGHEPPLLRRSSGSVESLGADLSGCPIGVLEDEQYRDFNIQPSCGDSLIVFSDGFPDAEHIATERQFGSAAIVSAFAELDGSPSQIVSEMVAAVDAFTENSRQFDDMCMVCVSKNDS